MHFSRSRRMLGLSIVFLLAFPAGLVSAASARQSCKKVGALAASKSGGKTTKLVCAKVGKKLVWVVVDAKIYTPLVTTDAGLRFYPVVYKNKSYMAFPQPTVDPVTKLPFSLNAPSGSPASMAKNFAYDVTQLTQCQYPITYLEKLCYNKVWGAKLVRPFKTVSTPYGPRLECYNEAYFKAIDLPYRLLLAKYTAAGFDVRFYGNEVNDCVDWWFEVSGVDLRTEAYQSAFDVWNYRLRYDGIDYGVMSNSLTGDEKKFRPESPADKVNLVEMTGTSYMSSCNYLGLSKRTDLDRDDDCNDTKQSMINSIVQTMFVLSYIQKQIN